MCFQVLWLYLLQVISLPAGNGRLSQGHTITSLCLSSSSSFILHFCTLTHSGDCSFLIFHLDFSTFCHVISLSPLSFLSQLRSLGQWDIVVCSCTLRQCQPVSSGKPCSESLQAPPCPMSGLAGNDLLGLHWHPQLNFLFSSSFKSY